MEQTVIFDHALMSVESFSRWMNEKVKPIAKSSYPIEFSNWSNELDMIRSLIEKPDRLRIALVGTTGAGKSTFLNAILGQEILPVGVMQPCTAFVTSVTHSPNPAYQVGIQFCTPEEWNRDLINLVSALKPGENDDGGDSFGDSKRLVEAAKKRISAVYGNCIDNGHDPDILLKMDLPSEVVRIFESGSEEKNQFDEAKDMLSYLRKLIRGESTLWPLIKQVNISGPYDCISGGLELIDLPGLNDPNEARVEITREFLRTSPFVWVIFPMVRGLTQDIRMILQEEKLLRTLVLSGTYDALSLVGTKADDIDTNIAPQLGLPEDCSDEELIQSYREQTVVEARKQLEQMVRDLAGVSDDGKTLERMIDIARTVRVHTISASAYNKLKGVGRLRKDYGIHNENDTGIPDVLQHLSEIGTGAGESFNAETSLTRLDQLRDEISFFFRGKTQSTTPEMEQARFRIEREKENFSRTIQGVQNTANGELKSFRERFLGKIDPLFAKSVQGVKRITLGWQSIHWATLRAIVQRDGTFKSPSTGRSYDLNENLAEPLLGQLPVSWEQYFTDDLGRVTGDFVVRISESGRNFCEKTSLIIELLFNKKDQDIENQLLWFQDKVSLLANNAKSRVLAQVMERRRELAAKMPRVAFERMKPGYEDAKMECGAGMKKRILGKIMPVAESSAEPIYSTIQQDLLEGLNDLEVIIIGMFRTLVQEAEKQAQIVAGNANIGIDESAIDPAITDLLVSIPQSIRRYQ